MPLPQALIAFQIFGNTSASQIVEGNLYSSPSSIRLMIPLKIFPLRVLGNLSTIMTCWKEATGPISFRIKATSSFSMFSGPTPVLRTTIPIGIYPFSSSILATTAASEILGCLNNYSSIPAVESLWPAVLMISSSLVITLRYPSLSKYPASPVVQQPGVSSKYLARNALSLLQRVSMKDGGMGNFMQTLPNWFIGRTWLSWLRISTWKPGAGLVALPGLGLKVCRFLQLQEIIHPHSVCQQLSLMRTLSFQAIHSQVGMSHRSPAKDNDVRLLISYLETQSPLLSSFLIALSPVGLVYSPFTRYFSTIAHRTPAFGSMGLPSYRTVAAPRIRGPQIVKLCPTTHPISLAAKQVSIALMPIMWFIVQFKATVVPPWSLMIPLGAPVVPEVYNIYKGSVEIIGSQGTCQNCCCSTVQGTQVDGHFFYRFGR